MKFHLFLSLSPHLYLTTRHKLKYVSTKMKPSAADKKSGKRIYLNRCMLMDENSGCIYLEYLPENSPCSLYSFLYRAFAAKEPEKDLLSGMPDILVLPIPRQDERLMDFLQGHGIGVESPQPGFRKGSSLFGQITRYEDNYEDDGLWLAPSTAWPPGLADLNRYMLSLLERFHNGLPESRNRKSRSEMFYHSGQEMRFPGDNRNFLSLLDQQTRQDIEDFETDFAAPKYRSVKKTLTDKDWFKADDIFDEGMEYSWSGQARKALQTYRRALEIHPGHVDAHVHIGNFLTRMGLYNEARESYRAAVVTGRQQLGDIEPGNAWLDIDTRPFMRALHGLGLVFEEQRAWSQALECYLELLKVDPDDHMGIRYIIGRIYHELDDTVRAEECYKYASDWPDGAWNLVWLYLEQGEHSKAARAAVWALEANAHVPGVMLERRFFSREHVTHCALYSYEQAVAYCQDYHLFLWQRRVKWQEFLQAFCSVPGIKEKIKEMTEAELPQSIPDHECEDLADLVAEKLEDSV